MFFFKRKKVTVDCFISNPTTHSLFRPDYANKFFPKGFKQLPAFVDVKANDDPKSRLTTSVPTLKRCVGITNLFNEGFILPAWTDFDIEMLRDGRFYKQDPMMMLDANPHPPFMMWEDLYKGYQHVKISSPWLIVENKGIRFTWNQCDWHNTDRIENFHLLSAVIDFKAQHNSHVNAFIKKGTITHVKAGDPLVHIVPITDKELDLQCHLIDDAEYNKLANAFSVKSMWAGQHRALLNQESKSKCPFGFK